MKQGAVGGDPQRVLRLERPLVFLKPDEINVIDELISALGSFGELRLVVEEGSLRVLASTRSYDALKWEHKE
ncbi:MAG: hypothetical protein PVF70_08635 [Anaerolineales bacterium]|jgi:hypothetical protein